LYEENKADVRKKLEEEDRVLRMKEGGEDMRAQIAMEEVQRSEGANVSGLTPGEEERRQMLSGSEPNRGLGETQQAEMAMWAKDKPSGAEHMYPAGTGGHYPKSMDEPLVRASTGEPFTGGARFDEGEPSDGVSSVGAMAKETGHIVVEKGKEDGHQVTDGAKELSHNRRAEDMANRAGESIGRALRIAMVIGKEISSGFKKGLGREKKEAMPKEQNREAPPR
jgi:hypothetical protein